LGRGALSSGADISDHSGSHQTQAAQLDDANRSPVSLLSFDTSKGSPRRVHYGRKVLFDFFRLAVKIDDAGVPRNEFLSTIGTPGNRCSGQSTEVVSHPRTMERPNDGVQSP
jgi:hypothetical protein